MSAGLALALGISLASPAWPEVVTGNDGSWDDGPGTTVTAAPAGRWRTDCRRTLAEGLVAPALGLAVGSRRTVYVTHGFPGTLITGSTVTGRRTDLVTADPEGLSGVDVGRRQPGDLPLGRVESSGSGRTAEVTPGRPQHRVAGRSTRRPTTRTPATAMASRDSLTSASRTVRGGRSRTTRDTAAPVHRHRSTSHPYAVAILPRRVGSSWRRQAATRCFGCRAVRRGEHRRSSASATLRVTAELVAATRGLSRVHRGQHLQLRAGPNGCRGRAGRHALRDQPSGGPRGWQPRARAGRCSGSTRGPAGSGRSRTASTARSTWPLTTTARSTSRSSFGNAITKVGRRGNEKVADVACARSGGVRQRQALRDRRQRVPELRAAVGARWCTIRL